MVFYGASLDEEISPLMLGRLNGKLPVTIYFKILRRFVEHSKVFRHKMFHFRIISNLNVIQSVTDITYIVNLIALGVHWKDISISGLGLQV